MSTPGDSGPAGRAAVSGASGDRRLLLILSLAIFMTNLDIGIVEVALPSLARGFAVDAGDVSCFILAYLLAVCAFLPAFGKLADRCGAVRIFRRGVALFTAASLFCAIAPGFWWLNAARFLQGLGGAMILATYTAIILLHFPAERRGRDFGLATVFAGAGIAAGPALGGFLLACFDWRSIFLVNLPFGLAIVALIAPWRETGPRGAAPAAASFDAAGAGLSLLVLAPLVISLHRYEDNRAQILLPAALAAVSVVALISFIRRERQAPDPLVDLGYFRDPSAGPGLLLAFLLLIVLDGLLFVLPFFLQDTCGFSPRHAGLLLMVPPLATIAVGRPGGWLTDRIGAVPATRAGIIVCLAGTALSALLEPGSSFFTMLFGFTLFGAGFGVAFPANKVFTLERSRPGTEGMLTALSALITYLGTLAGIAAFAPLYCAFEAGQAGYRAVVWATCAAAGAALVLSLFTRGPMVRR